eukprot:CAMPEP_0174889302 /NCGR_PEP_ID=MMETSP0167-20121228/4571_1 /TAXON_ID=38298 /ORGANISM="Rhodella maculata, Strain CCMP736" /LENGTH=289 /DNA_ID=CAMNT_0016126659 /DNA_START=109 /DNA_END=978 /DNA_ORIENTATION=-
MSSQPAFLLEGNDYYTQADQVARFNEHKATNNPRALDIDSVFQPELLKDKRIAITGCNRGLGLDLATAAVKAGAKVVALVRHSSPSLTDLGVETIIENCDVTSDKACTDMAAELKTKGCTIDILINNAGYFKEGCERILDDTMDFDDEIKTIDICAVGPLRVATAIFNAGLLPSGSKVGMITSQGGSVAWRDVQCPTGGDYGHHMSKAAANMAAKLCANELKSKGVAVGVLHPGFNRTDMTAKYKDIWDEEGAVEPEIGAKRVLHELNILSMETTGVFINCEDGKVIPW